MLDTTDWVNYPLEIDGVKFISKADPSGEFYPQIELLSEGEFEDWNKTLVREKIGDVSEMTLQQIAEKLNEIGRAHV